MKSAQEVLSFWFEEISPSDMWGTGKNIDPIIVEKFSATLEAAQKSELFSWRGSPEGRLAEIIVLDQFSRNIHRNKPQAFEADPLALALAQEAVAQDLPKSIDPSRRMFMVMPYMHSESKAVHEEALIVFEKYELNLDFEIAHKKIIDRFGHYPHRSKILGRPLSSEEEAFLKTKGSSF